MQPRADSLLTDLAHRVRLPAQLLVVLERCTLTLSRTRCPSPSGGSRVDGGRGSGARREQTNAAAYSRLWWRAAIRAAFQHSSLPSIRRARPVARPPVRARAHSRTVCLTFRHRHGGRVCQSRRLLRAVGLPFLPLNETFAALPALSSLDLHGAIFDRRGPRRLGLGLAARQASRHHGAARTPPAAAHTATIVRSGQLTGSYASDGLDVSQPVSIGTACGL